MLFPDVNVLVLAHRPDASGEGPGVRDWLTGVLRGHESVGISEHVLAALVRIVTHPRIFAQPTKPAEALAFCAAVRGAPAAVPARAGVGHWEIFAELVETLRLRGNDVPDAFLAALAMEQGATLVTLDRGFHRFEGLRVTAPG